MNFISRILALLLLLLAPPGFLSAQNQPPKKKAADLPWKDGERVVFLGDSITQDGRYVAMVELYLWAQFPERDIEIINLGVSGETVSGISENPRPRGNVHGRLTRALSESKPDWVLVCYGMNDGIYHPPSVEMYQAYVKGMTELVKQARATGAKIILMAPPVFDAKSRTEDKLRGIDAEAFGYPMAYRHYNAVLRGFGDFTREQKADLYVDFQPSLLAYIDQQRATNPNYRFGDGVHPDSGGHFTMALSVLEALGQNPQQAERQLARLTGMNRFPGKPVKVTNRALFPKTMARHQAFAAFWRGHSKKAESKGLKAAQQAADEAEKEIRALLEK